MTRAPHTGEEADQEGGVIASEVATNQDHAHPEEGGTDSLLLSPPPPVIGRVIGGNFRVLKLIGVGAMGHVFQAEQLSLGKMVALKLLRHELQGDEKLIKRFHLEAKNASSLNHPNSIQIIDFGRDGELLYIAMELLPGVDLGQLILREGPLPLQRLGHIMDQVLAALDEAHAQGIIHRDLKPGNIMLVSRRDEPDFVKVCDFGIAKAQTSSEGAGLTIKGLVCGTPEYMSPEQARGEDVDGRSDLYAVGVILYQLVTGELPFTASSPVGILSKHLAELPVPPSTKRPGLTIPAAFERVILHALAKEPADRPRTAEHLRRALRAALSELPDLATPPGTGHRALGSSDSLNARPTTPMGLPVSSPAPTQRPTTPDRGGVPRPKPRRKPRRVLPAIALAGVLGTAAWFIVAGPKTRNTRTTGRSPALVTTLTGGPTNKPLTTAGIVRPRSAVAPVTAQPTPAPPEQPIPSLAPPEAAALEAPIDVAKEAPKPAPAAGRDRRGRIVGSAARGARAGRTTKATATNLGAEALGVPNLPPSTTAEASRAPAETVAIVTPPASEGRPAAVTKAPIRAGSLDAMKEAERLLGQGDVVAACEKGEEQRNATPALAQVYKFLGKCYMRAGKPDKAMSNYRRYLELAGDAPDAAFVRSIVR